MTVDRKLQNTFGLKFNPFSPEIPIEGLLLEKETQHFIARVENLTREGGFAMISGEPGLGKSVAMRLLSEHLRSLPQLTVGELTRPQCKSADFYRELGDIFGVPLSPHNRWAGSKVLRE